MADLRPLYCVLPQEKPNIAVHSADLDGNGENFPDGAIRRRKRNSTKQPMCLRYGYLKGEIQSRDAANFEKQVLDAGDDSPEVEVEVIGDEEEDENGDRVFEIYFSQDNRNYLVQLFFGPEDESDDEDEKQEEGEGDDYSSEDGEETYEEDESDDDEETDEDYESDDEGENYEDDEDDDEDELTGKRVFELYFPQGDNLSVVRLVFDKEKGDLKFLEEGEEFLFEKLQRIVGISYEEEEEDEHEVLAIDNNNSSYARPEFVLVPEISQNSIEENGAKRSRIEYPKTENGSKIENAADPSGTTCVDDPLKILEELQRDHIIAQILRDHLELHSPLASPAPSFT